MRRDIVVGAEMPAHHVDQLALDLGGVLARHPVEQHAQRDVLQPHQAVGELGRQHVAQHVGDGVLRGPADDIGRRALQHRHMRGIAGDFGNQRHRSRTAADDDDLLARVVEVFGPELRVDDLPLEIGEPRKIGGIALGVAVIAAAHIEEIAGQFGGRAVRLGGHSPARVGARPACRLDLVAKADVALDIMLGGGFADIAANARAVGDRLGFLPRTEAIAQRVHVGVGPHAGIAEKIPGAAAGFTSLEDREAFLRAFLLTENIIYKKYLDEMIAFFSNDLNRYKIHASFFMGVIRSLQTEVKELKIYVKDFETKEKIVKDYSAKRLHSLHNNDIHRIIIDKDKCIDQLPTVYFCENGACSLPKLLTDYKG